MRKYGYLVVEGPHDVEFCYRLLSPLGVKRVQYKNDLDEFLYPLIPKEFPPKNGDLWKRMPTPLFLQNETHAIAIRSATGDSQLVNVLISSTELLIDLNAVVGIGILLDSDTTTPAKERYAQIKKDLLNKQFRFKLHDELGHITRENLNIGAFVLPDNSNAGTLENLLIESAKEVYPDLLVLATEYVSNSKGCKLNKEELKELNKPAGKNKAIIGAMANIMKPGKSVQVSIQDNRWVDTNIPRIKAVQNFLKELFEL